MKKIIIILLCFFSIKSYSQMLVSSNSVSNFKTQEINYSYPHKHKMDISNNVGLVLGGLVFITAGYLGERNISKDNGFQGIARVVSPGKVAMVLGSGCVIIGLTIKF